MVFKFTLIYFFFLPIYFHIIKTELEIDEELQRTHTIQMIACQQLTNQTFERDHYILKEILTLYKKQQQPQVEKKIKVGMIFHCIKSIKFEILNEITQKLHQNNYQAKEYEKYLGVFSWKKYQKSNIDFHLTDEETNVYESQGRLKNLLGKKNTESKNTQKKEQQQKQQNNQEPKQKEFRYLEKPDFKFEAPWLIYLIFGFSIIMFFGLAIYFTIVKFTSKDSSDSDSDNWSDRDNDNQNSSGYDSDQITKSSENKKND